MDMLRYLRSKMPSSTHGGARQREIDEFFRFQKTLHHGFPNKATCLAHDPVLNLLALGTKDGDIRIYGAPGVEFVAHHGGGKPVQRLLFLNGQGRIVAFYADQTFHLFETNVRDGHACLDHVKECSASGKTKPISCCSLKTESDGNVTVLIGTESGNVYSFDVRTFELTDHIIYQDAVIQNIPDDYKLSPGAVEVLAVHPTDPNKLLIGYNRGLIVLWDSTTNSARQTFVSPQQVVSLAWVRRGEKFVSSHNDGSYIVWTTSGSENALAFSKPDVSSTIPFGPFPCKAIDKIVCKTTDETDDDFLIFMGGMPRASYGDRNTVSVQRKNKQVCFDFNSRVLDFLTVDETNEDVDSPQALFVLCEEELVVIDFQSPEWPAFRAPYLNALHASHITACLHAPDVDVDTVLNKLAEYGRQQAKEKYHFATAVWPITGGENLFQSKHPGDLLITGHEDGTVKFWTAGGPSMTLLYILSTAKIFKGYNDPCDFPAAADEEDWPPFRKVGIYDPYSDDPRFGIQRLAFDGREGVLLVGGAAGQTMVFMLNDQKMQTNLQMITADLSADIDNFVWKGNERLELRNNGNVTFFPGMAPKAVFQMVPPASVTAVALQSTWGVAAVGTAHGFALFDYKVGRNTFKRCLLTPAEIVSGVATANEGTMSRFKSFKKSLRESFRRRRGPRSPKSTSPEPPKNLSEEGRKSPASEAVAGASSTIEVLEEKKTSSPKKSPTPIAGESAAEDVARSSPLRAVEREVAARTETVELNSMVRTMHFCNTYILTASTMSPTLWVGTNGGLVMALNLTLAETQELRDEMGGVQCQLAKEVRLRHRAPVLALTVVDSNGYPLDNQRPAVITVSEGGDATTTTTTTVAPAHVDHGHRLIVCSEEQLKGYHLPALKQSRHKFKLTAIEGARICKVQFANLQSRLDENKYEPFVVTMTNEGDVQCFSTHHFRRYMKQNCLPSSDVTGVLSTVLSRHGEGFYLLSSSEWQRFSVSARHAVAVACKIDITDGVRLQLAPTATLAEGVQELKLEEKQLEEAATEPKTLHADTSATSGAGDEHTTLNSSTLPSDVTIDSIRDYTTTSHSMNTESHVTDKGTVTIMQKVTKTVHTVSGVDGGTTLLKETKVEESLMNGDKEEPDDVTLTKSKLVTSSTQETKTFSSHVTSSTTAATAE